MDSVVIRLIPWAFQYWLFLASLASRFSFIHAPRECFLRVDRWLALVSVSACGENLSVERDFLLGL